MERKGRELEPRKMFIKMSALVKIWQYEEKDLKLYALRDGLRWN
jgi:hypothetical protein